MREKDWYNKNRWRLKNGHPERRPNTLPSLAEIKDRVLVPEFDKLAYNRLVQGVYRYGFNDANNNVDFIKGLKGKLAGYEKTHNTELLVDIRNYAMLEFKNPKYKDAYFESEDDIEHAPLKTNIK